MQLWWSPSRLASQEPNGYSLLTGYIYLGDLSALHTQSIGVPLQIMKYLFSQTP